MDSNDDSLFGKSDDSHSDQETDTSSRSSSHQLPHNKIIILSAESLSSTKNKTFELPSELDLGSYNIISKPGLNISTSDIRKGNPVVVKALPLSSSQHSLLSKSSSLTNEEENGLQIQNVLYKREKKRSNKKRDRNVTNVEKNILFKICEKYSVLNDKTCNNEINNQKRKTWEKIQKEFIATCPDPESKDRSARFLQGCWSRFQKETRKARRAQKEKEETTTEEFPNKCSVPSFDETEPQSPCNVDGFDSKTSDSVDVHHIIDSLFDGKKADTSLTHQLLTTHCHSNNDPLQSCLQDSVVNGNSKASLSGESLLQMNQPTRLCLNSAFEAKPMSIRSLRRKALELAVEVEKEKLAAFRYQREAEQERLASMKLQKEAQRYAVMVEKERYATELLKREATKLSLEKEKLS